MTFGKTGLDAWGYADVMQSALQKKANKTLGLLWHFIVLTVQRSTEMTIALNVIATSVK
jgi:hypothetical protein